MYAIYTFKADAKGETWDKIIANNEMEIVETFKTYDEATAAFDERFCDEDKYMVAIVND